MLVNPFLMLLGTLTALALYWSVPRSLFVLRQHILVYVSAALVFLYSVGGGLICLFLIAMPLLAQKVFKTWRNKSTFWLAVGFSLTPLVGLRIFLDQDFILSFGVAFATVKSLGLVLIAYSGRVKILRLDAALLILFFPLFTVGPVEKLGTFRASNFDVEFDFKVFFWGGYRIATGLFLIMFVANELLFTVRNNWFGRDLSDLVEFSHADAVGLIIVSFLFTYINFEGFSSVAIGIGKLFGIRIVENFDRPLMVSNLADFWKKYHISMGNWINQFLFFPIVVLLKKSWASYVATIITFILFGLWHAFTWNYFVWGLGNGLVVAGIRYGETIKVFPLIKTPGKLQIASKIVGGLFTLIFISWIQTFANLPDFETGAVLTCKLTLGIVGYCS